MPPFTCSSLNNTLAFPSFLTFAHSLLHILVPGAPPPLLNVDLSMKLLFLRFFPLYDYKNNVTSASQLCT